MSFWSEIQYFKPHEFDCHGIPGSGELNMDEEFIRKLDQLRALFKRPMRISSGYRTPEYNAKVSSSGRDGPHTTGKACDILVLGNDAAELMVMAKMVGFTGIGLNQRGPHAGRFIHLDTLHDAPRHPRPWLWTY